MSCKPSSTVLPNKNTDCKYLSDNILPVKRSRENPQNPVVVSPNQRSPLVLKDMREKYCHVVSEGNLEPLSQPGEFARKTYSTKMGGKYDQGADMNEAAQYEEVDESDQALTSREVGFDKTRMINGDCVKGIPQHSHHRLLADADSIQLLPVDGDHIVSGSSSSDSRCMQTSATGMYIEVFKVNLISELMSHSRISVCHEIFEKKMYSISDIEFVCCYILC